MFTFSKYLVAIAFFPLVATNANAAGLPKFQPKVTVSDQEKDMVELNLRTIEQHSQMCYLETTVLHVTGPTVKGAGRILLSISDKHESQMPCVESVGADGARAKFSLVPTDTAFVIVPGNYEVVVNGETLASIQIPEPKRKVALSQEVQDQIKHCEATRDALLITLVENQYAPAVNFINERFSQLSPVEVRLVAEYQAIAGGIDPKLKEMKHLESKIDFDKSNFKYLENLAAINQLSPKLKNKFVSSDLLIRNEEADLIKLRRSIHQSYILLEQKTPDLKAAFERIFKDALVDKNENSLDPVFKGGQSFKVSMRSDGLDLNEQADLPGALAFQLVITPKPIVKYKYNPVVLRADSFSKFPTFLDPNGESDGDLKREAYKSDDQCKNIQLGTAKLPVVNSALAKLIENLQ